MASHKNPYAKLDHFAKKAKAAGYPARSVYKLDEIDRRCRLLRGGMRVLDLGCAPGSWLLYAAQRVGPSGRVRGVDLKEVHIGLPAWAACRVGDALTLSEETRAFLGECAPYDVVLSDMAPSTAGDFSDQARSAELVRQTLDIAVDWLRPQGAWVAKFFMSNELPSIRERMRALFREERIVRPETTRSCSTEVFLVGLGKKS